MLGTSVKAVRRLLAHKDLPKYKLGKRYLIPVDALRLFVRKAAA
jgi:excisionase family DNA binding protein